MKISYKCDYALKIILYMSAPQNSLVHIEELSETQDIPRKFLEQILLDLKKGGFIGSKKGPNGGYYLLKTSDSILLGDIIRFIEGSVYPISCIDPGKPATCVETSKCILAPIWRRIGLSITKIIDSVNFKELAIEAEKKAGANSSNYCI